MSELATVKHQFYEKYAIRSEPFEWAKEWQVHFDIDCLSNLQQTPGLEIFGDGRPTLNEAHEIGLAMGRAILDRKASTYVENFTDNERRQIDKLRLMLRK